MPHKSAPRELRCPTKAVYASWDDAERAALLLIEDTQRGTVRIVKGGNVVAYCCSVCGRWHIGHSGPPKGSRPCELAQNRKLT